VSRRSSRRRSRCTRLDASCVSRNRARSNVRSTPRICRGGGCARGGFGLPTRRSTAGRKGRTLFTLIYFFNARKTLARHGGR
jgi:hypothetical protein